MYKNMKYYISFIFISLVMNCHSQNTKFSTYSDITYTDIRVDSKFIVIELFDEHVVDGDVIAYSDGKNNDTIKLVRNPAVKVITTYDTEVFTIKALSIGKIGLCTVAMLVNGCKYQLDMNCGQVANISLKYGDETSGVQLYRRITVSVKSVDGDVTEPVEMVLF